MEKTTTRTFQISHPFLQAGSKPQLAQVEASYFHEMILHLIAPLPATEPQAPAWMTITYPSSDYHKNKDQNMESQKTPKRSL